MKPTPTFFSLSSHNWRWGKKDLFAFCLFEKEKKKVNLVRVDEVKHSFVEQRIAIVILACDDDGRWSMARSRN